MGSIVKFLKDLLAWIFDVDESPSESVIKRSISGKPLLKLKHTMYGWSMSSTKEGHFGTAIVINITQLGNNVPAIKSFLQGEYEDYLSKDSYERLNAFIKERIEKGGYYLESKGNAPYYQGSLDFVRTYWTEKDKQEIKQLMEKL